MEELVKSVPSNNESKGKRNYLPRNMPRRKYILEPGLKGFLCSCNFREKECIRESYNLLNEYADILFENASSAGAESVEEEDSDKLLNEIKVLKSENKPELRRFQVVESGAKNFLFIRTTVEDPVKLAHSIMKDIHEVKKQKTRFLFRLIPIEVTCKAYLDNIKEVCKPLLEKYFSEAPLSYSVIFNHRNNNQLSKMDVITGVADLVASIRKDHSVNLTNPEISIVIEIIRNIALIGVIPNFIKYKKYNIHMNAAEEPPKTT